jgi:hypothetical protein
MTAETVAPLEATVGAYDEWRDRRWRLTGGLVVLLAAAFVLLAVVLGERVDPGTSAPGMRVAYGVAVPGWVALLGLAAWFGSWLLIIGGPQPWRATRWAWAWLASIGAPVGLLAFLLLGGPLGVGRPRNPARRLTGGWAFLLALVVLGGGRSVS